MREQPPEVQPELLIALVEERPVLWDKTLEAYKKKNGIREAWQEILVQVYENFESKSPTEKKEIENHLIKRWSNLRDAWIKSYKKQHRKPKNEMKKFKKYLYYDQMSFLNRIMSPHYCLDEEEHDVSQTSDENRSKVVPQQSRNRDKVNKRIEQRDQAEHTSNETVSRNQRTPVPATGSRLSLTAQRSKNNMSERKRKLEQSEIKMARDVNRVESENSNMHFFHGILPLLKDFTSEQKIDFRLEVLQIIKTIRHKRNVLNVPNGQSFQNYHQQQITPFNYLQYPQASSHISMQQNTALSNFLKNCSLPTPAAHGNASSNAKSVMLSPPSPADTNASSNSEDLDTDC